MKTIWITAINGFLGQEFYRYFQGKCNVLATSREQVNLCSRSQVRSFIEEHEIDVILHTASVGGRRTVKDDIDILVDNLQMFRNLRDNIKDRDIMLINFGSGAELDKSGAISAAEEKEIYEKSPKDYYGLAKNVIARCIGEDLSGSIFNIRLFGCFGALEKPDRLIRSVAEKILSGQEEIEIDDRHMSFFYAKDLCRIVEKYVEFWQTEKVGILYKDMNAVYDKPTSIIEIVKQVFEILGKKSKIKLNSFQEPYFGSAKLMKKFVSKSGIKLIGLKKGIEETVKELQNV